MEILKAFRYEIFFCTLLLMLLYPFFALLFGMSSHALQLISFSMLVFASFNLAMAKTPKVLAIIFGSIGIFGLGCDYIAIYPLLMRFLKIYGSCFFYMVLIYILTQNFLVAKTISLKVVIGAMSGYLLIGFLGATIIEMMEIHHNGSFKIDQENIFDFTYFSFVSMLTVGFGDIIPVTNSAKSLTIVISLIGQFYMAIGIASFVGKFMNK